jgi:hypothetical protein
MGLLWKAKLKFDVLACQAIAELEEAVAEEKRRRIPPRKIAPYSTGELFSFEEILKAMKEGSALGRATIEARKRFYGCVKS